MKNENNNVIRTIDGVLYYKYDYTDFLYQKLEDYKSKIDKAIEYIEKHKIEYEDKKFTLSNIMVEFNEYANPQALLEILKGDSNE